MTNNVIGTGDDYIQSWESPFDEPMRRIEWKLSAAEANGYDFSWSDVLSTLPEFNDALSVMNFYYQPTESHELVEAIGPAVVAYEEWDGGSPGQSGTIINVLVDEIDRDKLLESLIKVANALDQYAKKEGWDN